MVAEYAIKQYQLEEGAIQNAGTPYATDASDDGNKPMEEMQCALPAVRHLIQEEVRRGRKATAVDPGAAMTQHPPRRGLRDGRSRPFAV